MAAPYKRLTSSLGLIAVLLTGCASLKQDAPPACPTATAATNDLVVLLLADTSRTAERGIRWVEMVPESEIRALSNADDADRKTCLTIRRRMGLNQWQAVNARVAFYEAGPYYVGVAGQSMAASLWDRLALMDRDYQPIRGRRNPILSCAGDLHCYNPPPGSQVDWQPAGRRNL